MRHISIEQAIVRGPDGEGCRILARSPGFVDDWLADTEKLCRGFGERPAGVACPACVFAQPFGKRRVAVVQAKDLGIDHAGRPWALGFHLLVMSRGDYADVGGDPFLVAERFPAPWEIRGELPVLSWPVLAPPRRTVADVQAVLQREDGPNLLGGSQVLVDGGRLVFARPKPDTTLLRDLWTLLPVSTRCRLWPASFAFGNALGFDALVVPHAEGEEYEGYLTEEQAGEYPEGRYELHLQIAAEAEDQHALDTLFARRSRAEVWRYGLILLVVSILAVLISNWFVPPPRHKVVEPAAVTGHEQPAEPNPAVNGKRDMPP